MAEKEFLAELLLRAVMESEGDLCKQPYVVNKKNYFGYLKAVKILSELRRKGKCKFKAMYARDPYTLHSIDVKWNLTDDFYICIDDSNKREIKELLECTETCIIEQEDSTRWSLMSRLYIEK